MGYERSDSKDKPQKVHISYWIRSALDDLTIDHFVHTQMQLSKKNASLKLFNTHTLLLRSSKKKKRSLRIVLMSDEDWPIFKPYVQCPPRNFKIQPRQQEHYRRLYAWARKKSAVKALRVVSQWLRFRREGDLAMLHYETTFTKKSV